MAMALGPKGARSIGPTSDLVAVPGTGKVSLTGRGIVACDLVHGSSIKYSQVQRWCAHRNRLADD